MSKGPLTTVLSLALSITLVLPTVALPAGGGHGGGGGGGHGGGGMGGHGGGMMGAHGGFGGGSHGGGFHGRPSFGHGFRPGRPFNHAFFNRRFFGFGAFVSPAFWGWPWASYGWPYGYGYGDDSPYYDTRAAYSVPDGYGAYGPGVGMNTSMPPAYSVNIYNPPAPTAAPPVPAYEPSPVSMGPAPYGSGVVEYPGGRYVLRGDGMSAPYAWVWIPNPPGGPPGTPAAEMGPARYGQVYHWIDSEGVMHVTDRWEAVPQLYRQQAKKNLAS